MEKKKFTTTINPDLLNTLKHLHPNKPINQILEEIIQEKIKQEQSKQEEVKPITIPYRIYEKIIKSQSYRKWVTDEDLHNWFGNNANEANKFLVSREVLEPFKDYTTKAYKNTKDPNFAETKYMVNKEKLEALITEQYINNNSKKNLSEEQVRLLNFLLNYEQNTIKLTKKSDLQFLLNNKFIKEIPALQKYNLYEIDKQAIKEYLYTIRGNTSKPQSLNCRGIRGNTSRTKVIVIILYIL